MAASTLVVLPVLVLFFFTQRTFVQGIAATGGKN
jgi:multiple sugar transport system permease protein